MFSRIRKRFTFANVVMVFALVFAMTGGAYAASKYEITSTKQISPKVLKQLQGNAGAKGEPGVSGAAGSIGTQGPIGPAGPSGKNGENGAPGSNGEPGQNGKSVLSSSFTATAEPSGEPCHANGGTKLEREDSGAAEYICNGKLGKDGKSITVGAATSGATGECEQGGTTVEVEGEASTKKAVCNGSPWTAGGTLPSGKTETGGWAVGEGSVGVDMETAISFTIPLEAPIEAANTTVEHEGYQGSAGENCPGSAANPQAEAGHLCVYVGEEKGIKPNAFGFFWIKARKLTKEEPGTDTSGARIQVDTEESERAEAYARGTWAVTAP